MRIKLIFISIILANVIQAQTANYFNEDFYWFDKDTVHVSKIIFEENGRFELIEDNFYDCTPMFSVYGRGEYLIIKDSILFTFDSIRTLKSACKINSILNEDEYSNLEIVVVDQNGDKVENAKLNWGKPKRKRRWITAEFFEEKFSDSIELTFKNNETVNFVRIEKVGFYSSEIEIPKRPSKDYRIEVVLRPKPMVESRFYISNAIVKVAVISECEIQFFDSRKFKKESCN